jgi:DNA-binding transcriptional LysR family regulator
LIFLEITEGRTSSIQKAFVELCREHGFEPIVARRRAPSFNTSLAMAAAGEGIGFIYQGQTGRAPPNLVFRALASDWATIPVQMAWRRGSADPDVAALVRLAETISASG